MEHLTQISAFLMPLMLFSYWSLIGYSFQGLLRSQRNIIQNILLSPCIGIAVNLLIIFWLSFSMNLPVKAFGGAVTLGLFLTSLIILYFRKMIFPFKRYLPFLGLFFLDLVLVGRPLASYGFDWVSYSNDDMANYCLSAVHFLNHGYFAPPNMEQFIAGKDYTTEYWFMFVVSLSRSGSELLLAWVSNLTHLDPLKIFMPTIVALNLALLSAGMGMVYNNRRLLSATLALGAILSFSALTSLGTLYQLIAQVLGLGLLTTLVTVIVSISFYRNGSKNILLQSVLIAILLAALLIGYPEVMPFAVLTIMFFILRNFLSKEPMLKTMLILVIATLLSLFFIRSYFFNAIYFLFHQATSNVGSFESTSFLFPYYLIPSGLANLWGFLPIGTRTPEPILSSAILIGAILTFFTFAISIWLVYRDKKFIPAYMTLVMFTLGLYLFWGNSDFGLFKLAMYSQAFLIATLIGFLFIQIKNKVLIKTVVVCLIGGNIFSQYYYLTRSKALTAGSLTEVVFASNDKINKKYKEEIDKTSVDQSIITNDFNLSLLKFQMYETLGRSIGFCSFPIFSNFVEVLPDIFTPLYPKLRDISIKYYQQIQNYSKERFFDLFDPAKPSVISFRELHLCMPNEKTLFVIDKYKRSILNRSHFSEDDHDNFLVAPYQDVHNILSFISSAKGPIYYALSAIYKSSASFYNLESDWFYPRSSGQSLGRYLLFQIFHPSPQVRLVLNMTSTLRSDGTNKLPNPVVIGNKRYPVPTVGRGSARTFAGPIEAQKIGDNYFIEIDMQENGKEYPNYKPGLMKLFGRKINIDQRKIVVFGRNISLISEDEYQHLPAPQSISHFPSDLINQNLEYSGIYEDGWLSEKAYVNLMQENKNNHFVLRGQLPLIDPSLKNSLLIVTIDGQKKYEKRIAPGNFEVDIPMSQEKNGRKKIELQFSAFQSLPKGDGRPVAVKLEFLGFV